MQRLVLFGKRPRLGRVKTRLAAAVGPARALELYDAFLRDQIGFVAGFRDVCDPELCYDGPPDAERDPLPEGLRITTQGPGDLGRRMLRAFERSTAEGAHGTVVLAADAPTLPSAHLTAALDALSRGANAVLAPAADGGYVLIGLDRPRPELFEAIPWGTPQVLAETLARAGRGGLVLERLPEWYDVDEVSDLRRVWQDLSGPGSAARAPRTAALLAPSAEGRGRVAGVDPVSRRVL